MFYYPLYLWWQLTAVVPLRQREFLLTQRNCLTEKDGKYYLTLRRNNLKGKDKGVSHKISEDYYLTTYEVPFNLASEILKYLEKNFFWGFLFFEWLFFNKNKNRIMADLRGGG